MVLCDTEAAETKTSAGTQVRKDIREAYPTSWRLVWVACPDVTCGRTCDRTLAAEIGLLLFRAFGSLAETFPESRDYLREAQHILPFWRNLSEP